MRLVVDAKRFELAISPHLNAAYTLARWLTKNEHDAEDVVQESFIRAYQSYSRFRGGDFRGWLLKIIRNTSYTWMQKNRLAHPTISADHEIDSILDGEIGPEETLLRNIDAQTLRQAINGLPDEFREVVILRDLEGLSYKEIAYISDIPIGTVMSRLTRARKRLAICLVEEEQKP